MSNTTYRAFPEKLGATNPTKFVGDRGELFWDPENGNISFSDGVTPGGTGIKSRALEALESNQDQTQWVNVFGSSGSDWKAYYGSASTVDKYGDLWVVGGYEGVGHRATLGVFNKQEGFQYVNWRFVGYDSQSDYQFGEAIASDSYDGNDYLYVVISTDDDKDEAILVKINTDGMDIEWTREIYGGGQERGVDVVVHSDHSVFVVGSTNSSGEGGRDGYIVRYDKDGNVIWKQTLGGVSWDRSEAIAIYEDHLFAVGQTASAGQGGSDIFVAKLTLGSETEEPTIVWQKTIGVPESYSWEFGNGVTVSAAGNIYITGEAYSPLDESHTIYVAKLNQTGSIVWQKYLDDYSYAYGSAISVDASENVYVTGYAYVNYAPEEQTIAPQYDEIIVAKFDSTGELKYTKSFGTKYEDNLYYNFGHRSLTLDGDYLYVSGYTYSIDRNNPNGFVARFKADGEFEGIYGDFIAQSINLGSGDSNLVLEDSDLVLQNAADLDVTNSASIDIEYYSQDTKVSYRSPYEFRVRGALTADTTITRDLTVNQYPFANTDGNNANLCVGEGAGANHNGNAYNNIYLGYLSGFRNEYGDNNVYIGAYTGNKATDSDNTFVGAYSGTNQRSGSYNVILGSNIDLDDLNASTQMKIGSNGDHWLRGDSARSVYVRNNLVFETDSTTQIIMRAADGNFYALSLDEDGLPVTAPFTP